MVYRFLWVEGENAGYSGYSGRYTRIIRNCIPGSEFTCAVSAADALKHCDTRFDAVCIYPHLLLPGFGNDPKDLRDKILDPETLEYNCGLWTYERIREGINKKSLVYLLFPGNPRNFPEQIERYRDELTSLIFIQGCSPLRLQYTIKNDLGLLL